MKRDFAPLQGHRIPILRTGTGTGNTKEGPAMPGEEKWLVPTKEQACACHQGVYSQLVIEVNGVAIARAYGDTKEQAESRARRIARVPEMEQALDRYLASHAAACKALCDCNLCAEARALLGGENG
jgi:hypothetical protein